MNKELPYDIPACVFWHAEDERFYETDKSKADYVLMPIELYKVLQDVIAEFQSIGKDAGNQ